MVDSFGVGVPTYERPDALDRLLETLREQTVPPDELIVVDDGKQAATRAVVERYDEAMPDTEVVYLVGDSDTAQPGSRNRILDRTTCDVICYLDDDEVCTPEWLESIRHRFEQRPAVAGVGGPAIRADGELEPTLELLHHDENCNRLTRYGEFDFRAEQWVPPEPVETDLLAGGNMAFRTDALERIGGFDTDYSDGPAYYEETHVMARCWREGETLVYDPDVMVYHVRADTGGARTDHAGLDDYWFAKNTVLYIEKNFPDHRWRALAKLLAGREGYPPSIRRLLSKRLRGEPTADLDAISGYVSGVVEHTLGRTDG